MLAGRNASARTGRMPSEEKDLAGRSPQRPNNPAENGPECAATVADVPWLADVEQMRRRVSWKRSSAAKPVAMRKPERPGEGRVREASSRRVTVSERGNKSQREITSGASSRKAGVARWQARVVVRGGRSRQIRVLRGRVGASRGG